MNFDKNDHFQKFALGGVLALTAIAYLPVIRAGFVYDDLWFIVHNPFIRTLSLRAFFLDAASVASPGAGMAQDIYRPLSTLSFAVGHRVWGLNAFAEHAFNLFLHLMNGILLYSISGCLLKSHMGRVVATAVFLFHPAQVETVAWVSQRSTLLCAAGLLVALQGFLRQPVGWGRSVGGWLVSVFSKETGVMLAPLAAVMEWVLPREKASGARGPRWMLVAAWTAFAIPFWILRHHVVGGWSSAASSPFVWWQQLSLGALAFPVYLAKAIVPVGLRVSYLTPVWTLNGVLFGLWVTLSFIGACILALHRRSLWAVPLCGFGLLLAPVLHLIPIVPFVAERFFYLPIMGVGVAAGLAVEQRKSARPVVWMWTFALLALCILQVPVWKSETTLWVNAVHKDPGNAFAHACYAQSLNAGEESEAEYFKTLVSEPSASIRYAACHNLAYYYHEAGHAWKARYWKAQAEMRRSTP